MFRFIVLCALVAAALSTVVRYDNFKVYEVIGKNEEEIEAIHHLESETSLLLDVWRGAGRDMPAHISVAPQQQAAFTRRLDELALEYKVVVENVQNQIDEVDQQMAKIPKSARNIGNTYYNFEESVAYVKDLEVTFADRMSVVNFGSSRYDRELLYVKLSGDRFTSSDPADSVKPVIWMETTTHAREWITTACILNFMTWLLNEYSFNSDATFMLDTFDWFIVPVQNPDGYAHSHASDRMWRKTRTTGSCISWQGQGNGVDPNRNWGYAWGGGNSNRCAADYQGPNTFSEPCTSLMSQQMAKTPSQYRKAFLSLHSYSQLILTPYGHDRYAHVENYAEQKRVADAAAAAILANSGTSFRVGKPGELLYNAPGGAYDYAHGGLNYEYSLTYELHPASASPGFQLPPDKIAPSFSDFLASMIAIAKEIKL